MFPQTPIFVRHAQPLQIWNLQVSSAPFLKIREPSWAGSRPSLRWSQRLRSDVSGHGPAPRSGSARGNLEVRHEQVGDTSTIGAAMTVASLPRRPLRFLFVTLGHVESDFYG